MNPFETDFFLDSSFIGKYRETKIKMKQRNTDLVTYNFTPKREREGKRRNYRYVSVSRKTLWYKNVESVTKGVQKNFQFDDFRSIGENCVFVP